MPKYGLTYTQQATQRRKEVERLYALSQQLLLSENVFELLNKLPAYIADVFGATGVALFLENKQKTYFSDVDVLVQLLDNAAKYSPPETPIHISSELRNNRVITSIADHGPGIDEVEQTMIFERFYRGRNQRISVQGTGMGLSIARAIVELHGGTMGLTSQLSRGSVFYFSLPRN